MFAPLIPGAQNNIGGITGDESVFYAQTKQVNQFFRRFNAEEDVSGTRLYPGQNGYRDPKARRRYLNMIFDKDSPLVNTDQKTVFIEDVLNKKAPVFLDFHARDWYCEITTTFTWKKQTINIILYMRIEQQNGGYKWVLSNAYCDKFNSYFTHRGRPGIRRCLA